MNTLKNKKIAIVGGGPGGLTLARLLQQQGITVNVYERDVHKDARPKGATLDLHEESGLAALQEAGLIEAFKANYRLGADKIRIVDHQANIIFDEHQNDDHETTRPEIDRGPLQQILLESLKPETVQWDSQFVSLTRQDNGSWQLAFKNGKTENADIVVAADGANSKLRPYITPIKAIYTGYTGIEGAISKPETDTPHMYELLKCGKVFAMGDNRTIILSSKGDGSLVYYTGGKKDESWIKDSGIDFSDKAQVVSWLKEEYANWDPAWTELFEKTDSGFTVRQLNYMPVDQTWESQYDLTILGDAAHLMSPYAGEGVNMAMMDALELSRVLLDEAFTDTRSAIAAYEQQMRIRAAKASEESLISLQELHSPNAIPFMSHIMQ